MIFPQNGPTWIPVEGGSMLPLLTSGDLVLVEPILFSEKKSKLKVGEIVLTLNGSTFVLHRILESFSDGIVTKGDNQLHSEQKISRIRVIGRATRVKKRFGFEIPLVWPAQFTNSFLLLHPILLRIYKLGSYGKFSGGQ